MEAFNNSQITEKAQQNSSSKLLRRGKGTRIYYEQASVGGYTKRNRLVAERCFNRIYDKGRWFVFISLMTNSQWVVFRAGTAGIGKVEDTARGFA